jgi:hypothetical protein
MKPQKAKELIYASCQQVSDETSESIGYSIIAMLIRSFNSLPI